MTSMTFKYLFDCITDWLERCFAGPTKTGHVNLSSDVRNENRIHSNSALIDGSTVLDNYQEIPESARPGQTKHPGRNERMLLSNGSGSLCKQ
jgi:hypothetical protein